MKIPWMLHLHKGQSSGDAPCWSPQTYPDPQGFARRVEGMIERIASQGFDRRTRSRSYCPDTHELVLTSALAGELIASPYTGKTYTQGFTGYFGPRERDDRGRITRYGGDPLKYDLPPAMAALLLDPKSRDAHTYLGQPGSMRQQYHFAAKNWARFYPILSEIMGEEWRREFQELVGEYQETRKPSDGYRELDPWVGPPHNLVGEPGEFLGGGTENGGTENHKVMWRTSCLVYAQHFAEDARISHHPVPETLELVKGMMYEFGRRLLKTGNGEYDSCIYYPHSIEGLLNLYDFSVDRNLQTVAQVILDYYHATAGLKIVDGAMAGAQKRGYLSGHQPTEFESIMWAWTGKTSKPTDEAVVPIHQVTTQYRPNRVIRNIIEKNIGLPFEARMRRPTYHMDGDNAFQEMLFCSESFGLGSVALTHVDNPTQQVVWSLVAAGAKGPMCFGGGQPQFLTPYGHSPYTQTIQHRAVLAVLTGQTAPMPEGDLTGEQTQRYRVARRRLGVMTVPAVNTSRAALRAFLHEAARSAATWLYVPRGARVVLDGSRAFIEARDTLLAVHSVTGPLAHLDPDPEVLFADDGHRGIYRFFEDYSVIISSGAHSGYVLEAAEKSVHGTLENFQEAVKRAVKIEADRFAEEGRARYRSLEGDVVEMRYDPTALRARGAVNGSPIDYGNWADGAAYDSPYVKVRDGVMTITDGKEGYVVDFTGEEPRFRPL